MRVSAAGPPGAKLRSMRRQFPGALHQHHGGRPRAIAGGADEGGRQLSLPFQADPGAAAALPPAAGGVVEHVEQAGGEVARLVRRASVAAQPSRARPSARAYSSRWLLKPWTPAVERGDLLADVRIVEQLVVRGDQQVESVVGISRLRARVRGSFGDRGRTAQNRSPAARGSGPRAWPACRRGSW